MPEPNGCEPQEVSPPQKNEIVVYQPDEMLRLDVRLENETVWLTQSQMGTLFGCTTRNVRLHLENIYAGGELAPESTRKDFFLVRREGARRVRRLVKSARKSLLLVDNWTTVETLDMLADKQKGVAVTVLTSEHPDRKGNPRPKILPADVAKFNAQYPTFSVRFRENFHDRFLVVDDRELYLIGASLKDLGKKVLCVHEAGRLGNRRAQGENVMRGLFRGGVSTPPRRTRARIRPMVIALLHSLVPKH